MGLLGLLFSFKGRINRAQYWLGSLGVGVVSTLVTFMSVMPSGGMSPEQIMADKAAGAMPAGPDLGPALLMLAVSLVSAWCGLAIQVKRFHDRGQSGLWTLLPLLPLFGMMGAIFSAIFGNMPLPQAVSSIVPYLVALLVINFGFFINLGCLAGTDGPNKYGDGPGHTPSSPAPVPGSKPRQAEAASAIFGNAEAAMQRAVAERQKAAAAAPAPMSAPRPAMAGAPAASGGFGRKAAR